MKELAQQLGFDSFADPWLAQILATLIATAILHVVVSFMLRHTEQLAKKTANNWDDALLHSTHKPALVAVWLVGISYAAGFADEHLGKVLLNNIHHARDLGLLAAAAWLLQRFTHHLTRNIIAANEKSGADFDRTTIDALSKLARLAIIASFVLIGMQMVGASITGLITMGGIGGIVIGFAAKDLLANFFGGLTIYLDRPFSVGDWVRSPDKAIEGTVENISWRHTRIRGFNKNPLYVPNALFTTIVVENPSRMSHRRIKETIGIRYSDLPKMAAITADIKAMLQSHPEIDNSQTLIVNFNEFADSSLNIMIYTFTKTVVWVRYHEVKQDVLLKIADVIERHNAEIAFPTRTLHVEQKTALTGD